MSAKTSKPFKPPPLAADTVSMSEEDQDIKSGRVKFDDRGNAIWEWAVATGAFGRDISTTRLRTLEHPKLSIAEEAPTPVAKKSYNPYDSDKLAKAQPPRKKDLRKLSEWLKLKKQAEENKKNQESED